MGVAVHQRVVALSSVPFELRVLEGLLDQTLDYLESKAAQIRMLSHVIQDSISSKLSLSDIRRLLPLQKAITALQYDIKETQEAITEASVGLQGVGGQELGLFFQLQPFRLPPRFTLVPLGGQERPPPVATVPD